ncbi:MAG: antibiotic biosynthesis monooxygenase family protein [Gilvibacter sp.]
MQPLTRIVKMEFKPEHIPTFKSNFNGVKEQIRAVDGCEFLELYQDQNSPTTFFTYSKWESDAHLQQYRNSALFGRVWKATKILFNDAPAAWSVDTLHTLA